MKIDFVSDVACPWCAVGLAALEGALATLPPTVPVELQFQPFELNPTLPPEGCETVAYLTRKYGSTPQRVAQMRETIRARGAEVGFRFGERPWVWNTFDAHRLMHWAGLEGRAHELKRKLLAAYHTDALNPGAHEVLLRLVGELGMDVARARAILESDAYVSEVRAAERHWQQLGIDAVPSIVVDGRHLIQGAQPVEAMAQALRQIAAESDPLQGS